MLDAVARSTVEGLLLLMLLTLIALGFPYRRTRRFSVRKTIAAPRERIWKLLNYDPDDPESLAVNHRQVSQRAVADHPSLHEEEYDVSGGHRTNIAKVTLETLHEEPLARASFRVVAMDNREYPFGREHVGSFEITEGSDGCVVTMGFCGETLTLWQYLAFWTRHVRYLRRLGRVAEQGVSAGLRRNRTLIWSLGLSVAAILSFAVWFGWLGAIVVSAVLVLHEFGHWLAMRLTGQPAPKMLLIPFFGGVAVPNHPHKTLLHDAFCSLMGPGLSAIVGVGILFGLILLEMPTTEFGDPPGGMERAPAALASAILLGAGFAIGGLNLLQLLPLMPLDGGQILRTIVQSCRLSWARPTMLTVALCGIAAFAYWQIYLGALLFGVGALQAYHMHWRQTPVPAMNWCQIAAIVVGYLATVAIHGTMFLLGIEFVGHFLRG